MKSSSPAEILLNVRHDAPVALHLQLERELRAAIRQGRLVADATMPSTRVLAAELGVSRGVVVEAYEQLVAEGYLVAAAGSGTRVAALQPEALRPATSERAGRHVSYDFQPGVPDVASFPRRAWFACLRRGFQAAGSGALRYPNPRGPLVTRAALAAYLGRSRATVGQADRMVLAHGFTQSIDLTARLLKARGVREVAIEEPGPGALDRLFEGLGITPHPVPVDEHGLVVAQLVRTRAQAVVVTPGHQYPTGASLVAERRTALLAWARERDALIVEDDYDSEFRYDREPLGALQGLDPQRVIYIGTASKMLSPAFRLGWILAPGACVEELALLKDHADRGSPTIDQLALAEFLNSGEMDRHLRRMRPIYRRRRDALAAALAEFLPGSRVRGVSAGLHLMVDLPPGIDEQRLQRAALEHSIRLFVAGSYRAQPRADQPAMVLGYGCIEESRIRDGVARIAQLVAASSTTHPPLHQPAGSRRYSAASSA